MRILLKIVDNIFLFSFENNIGYYYCDRPLENIKFPITEFTQEIHLSYSNKPIDIVFNKDKIVISRIITRERFKNIEIKEDDRLKSSVVYNKDNNKINYIAVDKLVERIKKRKLLIFDTELLVFQDEKEENFIEMFIPKIEKFSEDVKNPKPYKEILWRLKYLFNNFPYCPAFRHKELIYMLGEIDYFEEKVLQICLKESLYKTITLHAPNEESKTTDERQYMKKALDLLQYDNYSSPNEEELKVTRNRIKKSIVYTKIYIEHFPPKTEEYENIIIKAEDTYNHFYYYIATKQNGKFDQITALLDIVTPVKYSVPILEPIFDIVKAIKSFIKTINNAIQIEKKEETHTLTPVPISTQSYTKRPTKPKYKYLGIKLGEKEVEKFKVKIVEEILQKYGSSTYFEIRELAVKKEGIPIKPNQVKNALQAKNALNNNIFCRLKGRNRKVRNPRTKMLCSQYWFKSK